MKSRMIRKVMLLMLTVGAVALVWREFPTLARYTKMTRM